jgi:serine/threonine protein kinase/tetratricopeptide (TPR) repeat protein
MTLGHCRPEDALARYLTARLGDDELARIDSHLGSCGSCSARLDQLSAQNGDAFLAVLRTAPGGRTESDEFDRDVAPRLSRTTAPTAELPVGAELNGYRLLAALGQGGMGRVYRARHARLEQDVAVKIVAPGVDSEQVRARFDAERHALAQMDHPNIARVLDGGVSSDGRPFFVMELVDGVPITTYCDRKCLPVRARLGLFIAVCQAVQHAHQKGIIHRDIKPSNVLVTEYDSKPVPKVIDFGVAKAIGQRGTGQHTELGMVVGTPEYMSPEQAGLDALDVDTRSDIYALGVLLFELLTGDTPLARGRLRETPLFEVLRLIREEEPPAPSTRLAAAQETLVEVAAARSAAPGRLPRELRGDLDWIVLKALDKDRRRRYESAAALALDVERFLRHEPTTAGPPSRAYRLRKFVRRNRGAVLAAGLVSIAIAAGTTGTSVGLIRARQQRSNAELQRDAKDVALTRLEKEQDATRAALLAESSARRHAMASLRLLSDEFIERQLGGKPELTADSRQFLRTVLAEFEAFAATQGDGAESRAIRAEGNFRVGLLQSRLGATKEAIAAYGRARDLYQALAAEFPSEAGYRFNLGRARNNLAIELDSIGETDDAGKEYRAASDLWATLLAMHPGNEEYLRHHCYGLSNTALWRKRQGDLPQASTGYKEALQCLARLLKMNPRSDDYRHREARCRLAYADVLKDSKQYADALEQVRSARTALEELQRGAPQSRSYRHDLARTRGEAGQLLEITGPVRSAEDEYRASLRLLKQLAADFPSAPVIRADLANCHANLAILLRKAKRLDEAEVEQSQSLALSRALATEFPDVLTYAIQLGGSYCNHGDLLAARGNCEDSLEWFDRAIMALKPVLEKQPAHVIGRRYLRNSHWSRAYALQLLQRDADSLPDWDRAIALDDGSKGRSLRLLRGLSLARVDPAKAVADAEDAIKGVSKPNNYWFMAACVYATAADQSSEPTVREQYATRAVGVLREAYNFVRTPSNVATLKMATQLNPIRDRDDFKKLIAELESARR